MHKDELRNIISGKNEVRNGTAIQAISCYLKRRSGASKVAKNEKHFKKQETTLLKEFVTTQLPTRQLFSVTVRNSSSIIFIFQLICFVFGNNLSKINPIKKTPITYQNDRTLLYL